MIKYIQSLINRDNTDIEQPGIKDLRLMRKMAKYELTTFAFSRQDRKPLRKTISLPIEYRNGLYVHLVNTPHTLTLGSPDEYCDGWDIKIFDENGNLLKDHFQPFSYDERDQGPLCISIVDPIALRLT